MDINGSFLSMFLQCFAAGCTVLKAVTAQAAAQAPLRHTICNASRNPGYYNKTIYYIHTSYIPFDPPPRPARRRPLADVRERQYEASGLGSSYLFRIDDEWVCDATMTGGRARFINHSCDPNCYTKIVAVEGQKRIGIYSKRRIAPGEELFYDYKFDFEEEEAKVPCMCGAKACRKFMN